MIRFIFVLFILTLSGCASVLDQTTEVSKKKASVLENEPSAELALVEPAPVSQAKQAEFAQLSRLLEQSELTDEQRTVLHYRRAILFDEFGLPTLALLDMNQALEINPALAEAWNFLGVYYVQQGNFQMAYEAFDSVLELQPEHEYVYLNRGLAAYFDEQYELAYQDLADYYFQNQTDGHRIAWLYFSAYELDSGRAEEQLSQHLKQVKVGSWDASILLLFEGELPEHEFLKQAFSNVESHEALLERLCEAYFYLGKKSSMAGELEQAMNFYKLALMTNVYSYVEYRAARAELYRLRQQAS